MTSPLLIRNVTRVDTMQRTDLLVKAGHVARLAQSIPVEPRTGVIDGDGALLFPGFVDVHVHLREPGFSYKETIAEGTLAAAHGGFTTVCPMPNLNPAPDTRDTLDLQLELIRRSANVEVLPYATITRRRAGIDLIDYSALAPFVAGFSDDGSGIQNRNVMRDAMAAIAPTGKVLAAHCEVNALIKKGYIHDGEYARIHGHLGICSESEWKEVERNIELCAETGCRLHICHISTYESVNLIRQAKADGLPVTCETASHYLAFSDNDLQEDGRFKMNPPLRSAADREALLEGVADGTIDCLASDHAPHSADEKSRGLQFSAMGVTGLEVSASAFYTYAILGAGIPLARMYEMLCLRPREIFGIQGGILPGQRADFTLFNPDATWTVDPSRFLSKGKSTPFAGLKLNGKVKATIVAGKPYIFE